MTTKLCNFCSKEIPENAKICPYCNKALADKVFTYMNQNKSSGFDVSKFTKEEKTPADNYFNTNIYSFSESEIEKRFERKPIAYEEEEKTTVNEDYFAKREPVKRTTARKRKKQKNLLYPVGGVLLAIVLLIVIISSIASGGKDNNETPETTSTTKATTSATTTTTTEATSTTTQAILNTHSVDLDGYLGVSFESVSDHFGDQIQDTGTDEFYGGDVHYYDGMTITTSGNGNIVSMDVDYTKVQNKDTYYFKNVTYYSVYDHVVTELGEPDENLMSDPTEPCIRYVLDIGSGQVIQFEFDDNNKVSKFSMFYAD
ncbi:MAG: zinc ribbon domain-containing protein [Clostridia bacterium]|nr:zinc ribbon domain-containing protein [Clostridia bacterium]